MTTPAMLPSVTYKSRSLMSILHDHMTIQLVGTLKSCNLFIKATQVTMNEVGLPGDRVATIFYVVYD